MQRSPGSSISEALTSDRVLTAAVFALLAAGLVMVYSASFIFADEHYRDGLYFFRRHGIYAVVGLLAFALGWNMKLRRLRALTMPLMIATGVSLVLTHVPGVGHKAGGASRWIGLFGFTFQPAELAKVAILFFVARQIERKMDSWDNWRAGFMAYFVSALPIYLLLMSQPDFGTTALLVATTFAMLFAMGARLKYIGAAAGIAIPGALLLIFSSPYRKARLLGFLDPWSDPAHKGFQAIQSFLAFYQGKFLGVGLGNSREKLFYLPEAHTDFIFSVVGEELGFVGVASILILFLVILLRGLRCAEQLRDPFAKALSVGITSLIGVQALCNMGVVLGLLPTKGFTLPLVSYGGTSLIVSLFLLGILTKLASTSDL